MHRIILILCATLPLISSCSKEKGCTNLDALNYQSNAEKDDGTCEFLYIGFQRIYLDSTHALTQDSLFSYADHEFLVKISSDRYTGPDFLSFEYTNLNFLNEYSYVPTDEIVVTNEDWQFDVYLDDESNKMATFIDNPYKKIGQSTIPNVVGILFKKDGLNFEFSVHK